MAAKHLVFKRFLNVLFGLSVVWSIIVFGLAGFALVSQSSTFNWSDWLGEGVTTAIGSLALVGSLNYISFGKFKLWHSLKQDS